MNKTNKEIKFKYYATELDRIADQTKSIDDIAFVGGNSKKIYSKGIEFGTTDLSNYYTKVEIDNIMNNFPIVSDEDIDSIHTSIKDIHKEINDINSDAEKTKLELNDLNKSIRDDIEISISNALKDSNGRTIWNRLSITDNELQAITTKLNKAFDSEGNLKYTSSLQSLIDAGIEENKAFANISNNYAVLDENQDVIKWMVSGFKSQAEKGGSFALLFAAQQDSIDTATSQIKSEILNDVNGKYVAKNSLSSLVIDIIEDGLSISSLSDISTKSYVDGATTQIVNQYQLDDLLTSLSAITSQSNADHAKIEAITSTGANNTVVLNQSTLDDAIVKIMADSNTGTYSEIHSIAGNGYSEVEIKALAEEQAGSASSNIATKSYVDTATGDLVSQSSLTSQINTQVDSKIAQATSGFVSMSDVNSAVSNIVSTYELEDMASNVSAILTKANSNEAKINAITSTDNNNVTVLNQSTLDEAMFAVISNSNSSTSAQIQSIAGSGFSITEITDAVETAAANGQSSIASKTYVDNKTNGLVSLANVSTIVETQMSTALTNYATKSYVNEQKGVIINSTELSDKIESAFGDLSSNFVTIQYLNTEKDNWINSTSLTNKIDDMFNSASAGFLTSAYFNEVSQGFAAKTLLQAIADNNGNITAASIVAAVNNAGSTVTIDADRINLNGETWVDYILSGIQEANSIEISSNRIYMNDDVNEYQAQYKADSLSIKLQSGPTTIVDPEKISVNTDSIELNAEDDANRYIKIKHPGNKYLKVSQNSVEIGQNSSSSSAQWSDILSVANKFGGDKILITNNTISITDNGYKTTFGPNYIGITSDDGNITYVSISDAGITDGTYTKTWTQLLQPTSTTNTTGNEANTGEETHGGSLNNGENEVVGGDISLENPAFP